MDDITKKEIEIGAEPTITASSASSTHSENETDHESNHQEETIRPHPSRTSSYRSSSYYPPIVPRHLRRGLLSRFTLVPEVTQPYHYPNRTKWLITFTVACAAAAAPMGSAIIMPSLGPISREFNVSPTITNLSVALYMLSMSIFPLWWSSFSETLGRRTIYIVSFILFVLWGILSAVSKNIAMLIVMRVLSGGAAASVQAVGAGTIADIWEPKERGKAMGTFYLGPLMGPFLAPIIGGALGQGLGWRSTQWFLVIFGGVLIIFLILALPETLKARKNMVDEAAKEKDTTVETEAAITGDAGGQIDIEKDATTTEIGRTTTLQRSPTRKSVVEKSRKYIKILKRCFVDPLKIILLLRYPAVALTVFYASITFGALYFLNISIETTFSKAPYNFSTLIVGLLYIPNSLGYLIASLFGGRWLDHIMKREARKAGRIDERGRLIFRPEDRMRENAWVAGFIFPAALIWYGWTAEKGVHWIVPVILSLSLALSWLCKVSDVNSIDDLQFFLRPWIHDRFRHGNYDADRVHAQTCFNWYCGE
jgi:multidrug resistance protein